MISMFRKRYFRILWFFGWMIVGIIGWDLILPRLGLGRLSRATRPRRLRSAARGFRRLAVQLGGVMIKVGQLLSSRLDVLPREVTDELSGLQDEVASEPFEPIRQIIESEFGQTLAEKFGSFNPVPIASASIGQVYCARLCAEKPDGSPCPDVVVKVQRPQIEAVIEVDLAALRVVAGWMQKYPPISRHANVPRLMEEFSRVLYEEIDYLHEGKNAETFAENFRDDPRIRVPRVIWSHTTKRVLTLEDVGGIKITDNAAIDAVGIDRAEVAKILLDTYLKQVFKDNFFHADPHPGNLFIQAPAAGAEPGAWKLTFVDFGMAGTMPANTFNGLREVLISVGTQDAHRLMQAYQDLDMLLPGADLELLARASQRVFERFWGKSTLQMVDMGHEEAFTFIDEFGDLLYEMPFQLPENLILLGRCVSILSGISVGLDPKFNAWEGIAPYASTLVETEGGSKWQSLLDEAGKILQKLLALPARTDALIARMEEGRLDVRTPSLTRAVEKLDRSQRRTAGSVVFAALLLSGVQLYLAGETTLAAGFGAAAALALLWVLLGR